MLGVIVLAAGNGTRMNYPIPKVLLTIGNRPILRFVLDEVQTLCPHQVIVVISPKFQEIPWLQPYDRVVQDPPNGTGGAVRLALQHLSPNIRKILVVLGDTPLLQAATLQRMLSFETQAQVLAMHLSAEELKKPYGRLDVKGTQVCRIVEWKEANANLRESTLVNSGVMSFQRNSLESVVGCLTPSLITQEYYLTDLIELLSQSGQFVSYQVGDREELSGINNLAELESAASILQNRWRTQLLLSGVRLMAPSTIFLSHDTQIASGVTVAPYVTFGEKVKIESHCSIFSYSHLEDCYLKEGVQVGPFVHIRGQSILDSKSCVGNFVEIKKTHLKTGAKAKHLTYLGDAEVGAHTNIGAGTITCNYDGHQKHQTKIGAHCFIGANTCLVAPIQIGNEVMVAAGSTITQNVEPKSLAFGRGRQVNKPWKLPK
jgi:bifunctional UDP-N-acetylglucosamine pyrophosphorylase/glucosamine-1-phosphate N-acetyltransferase